MQKTVRFLKLGLMVLNLQLVLEEIIGLTTKNGNGLASNISTARCAYVAGCVVVVYNVDSATQSHLIVSHRVPKPLCCVAMSKDGRFVAAGEVQIKKFLTSFHFAFEFVIRPSSLMFISP